MIKDFKKNALIYPDRIAYVTDGQSISYSNLCCLAKKRAEELEERKPVVLAGDKGIDFLSYILACTMKGIPYVPIEEALPEARKDAIFQALGEYVYIDCISGERVAHSGERKICIDNCVYVIFTSGSTGQPKGVPITRENLNSFYKWISRLYPLCNYKECAVMNQAPFSFDLSVADLYYALGNGHTLIGASKALRENVGLWLNALKENGAKVCMATPTFIRMCLLSKDFSRENFPDLDCIYFCGERLDKPLVRKLWDRFGDLKIINAYGPTEATSAVSAILIKNEYLDSPDPLPVGEIENLAAGVEIIDDEIVLFGKSVFSGYLNADSSGCFTLNGENAYKTGDIGYIKENRLYCTGRRDTQVKYAGYRIELGDVEENVRSAEGVRDAAVVALKDENGSVKRLRAFVVLEKGYTADGVREKLNKRLPSYMVPQIIVVDTLIANENAKLDRRSMSE